MQDKLVVEGIGDREVLRNIPVCLDIDRVMKRLSFHRDVAPHRDEAAQMVEKIVSIARPDAVYKSSPVSDRDGNYLKIDGIEFNSPLLRVNLKGVDRVFPYAVTCGKEMDSLTLPGSRSNSGYVMNILREMVLAEALNYLRSHIANRYNLDYLWSLQPGELQAWPAADRILLLSMLGDVEELIGVRLSNDGLLAAEYSACGIFYDAAMEFEGCQVCPQEPCMGRRAPYCEELAQKYPDRARRPCGRWDRSAVSRR